MAMDINAMAVANYFVKLSTDNNIPLRLIGLIKRVYIAHGFSLALLDKPMLDERFDKVEAWRHGPVIPSVYHTFKYKGKDPISELGKITRWVENDIIDSEPVLTDENTKAICDMVWERYKGFSDWDLVDLLHRPGSPWALSYIEGANNIISDDLTQEHYKRVVEYARQRAQR